MALCPADRSCDFHTASSISGQSERHSRRVIVALVGLVTLLAGARFASAETARERCARLRPGAVRADAIAACDEALRQSTSAETMWAAAEVRMARPETPTTDDFIRAQVLGEAAVRLAPGEPWGYLARLAIARRWGDPELTAHRLEELARVAPGDPRTLQAARELRPARSWAQLGGGAAIVALVLFTLAHAWRRRRRVARARSHARLGLAASLLLASFVALGAPGVAHAGAPFPLDDADPERLVPTPAEADARPLEFAYYLEELTEHAAAASARGDHAAAVRYYRALARAVPDSSLPLAHLCSAALAAGQPDAALAACRGAITLPGVRAEDFVRFGDLVLAQPAPSAAALADVEAAARHLAGATDTRVVGLQLECRLGVRTANRPLLAECSAALAGLAPADPSTYVYAWTLALERAHLDDARQAIEHARAAGLGEAALARMEAATRDRASAGIGSPRLLAGAGVLVLFLGLGLLWRSTRRRQWATTTSGSV
jgi:hypothetical protein